MAQSQLDNFKWDVPFFVVWQRKIFNLMNQPSWLGPLCLLGGWNLFIYFLPVKIRGWHSDNQHTIYLGTGRGMFWWKLKNHAKLPAGLWTVLFIHSRTWTRPAQRWWLKKCQFEKLSFQQNAFKEWRKCTISSQYDGSGVKMFILFAMRWVDPLTAFRKTTPWHYGEWR